MELLIGIVKKSKEDLQATSQEQLTLLQEAFGYLDKRHTELLQSVTQETEQAKQDFSKEINTAKKLIEEIKAIEVKDGIDGVNPNPQDVVPLVLKEIKIPEETGETIVDKINALSLKDENKIDAKHIKNLSSIKGGGHSPTVLANAVDLDQTARTDGYAVVWDDTNKRFKFAASGGGSGIPGGSDPQLQYNNAGSFGGISGATTDGTAVTYTTGNLKVADVKASGSGGVSLLSSAGTTIALFGAGGGNNATFYDGVKLDAQTASTITIFDGSKNLVSADTATYPSLTELSYVKGVTSAIQTQLNGKASTTAYTLAGVSAISTDATKSLYTMTSTIPVEFKRSGGSTLLYLNETNGRVGLGTTTPTNLLDVKGVIDIHGGSNTNLTARFGVSSTDSGLMNLYSGGVSTALIATNQDSYLLGGNFGVGTNSPAFGSTTGTVIGIRNTSAGSTLAFLRDSDSIADTGVLGNIQFYAGSTAKTLVANVQATVAGTSEDAGAIRFYTKASGGSLTERWRINENGHLLANTDNTYDLGAAGATRFRTGYFGTSVRTPYLTTVDSGNTKTVLSMTSGGSQYGTIQVEGTGGTGAWSLGYQGSAGSTIGTPVITWNGSGVTTFGGNVLAGTDNTYDLGASGATRFRTGYFGTSVITPLVSTPNNAITASGNAATVPVTSSVSTVTNNSAATLTITITTTNAVDGQKLIVRILDASAVAQTISWVNTENSGVSVPTTSNGSTTLPLTVGFMYNSATSKWRCVASV